MITKTHLAIGAAALVLLQWYKGQQITAAAKQVEDSVPRAGSDWIGTMWDRLSGTDLVAPGYPNLAAGAVADPGKVGILDAKIAIGWDGSTH